MRDAVTETDRRASESLADLLAEFQQPGQPLHGFSHADAERIFVQVVEQLLLKAIRERSEHHTRN